MGTRARAMSTTVALRHARRCAKTLFARTAARANTAASQASIDAFMEKFDVAKTSPTMDCPSTPTTFASAPVEESAKGTADKLKLNFYLPHEVALRGGGGHGARAGDDGGLWNLTGTRADGFAAATGGGERAFER